MKKPLPVAPVKFPNRVKLDLHPEKLSGPTPILDKPFTLDPGAGKAKPEKPSKTLFRKGT